MPLSLGQVVQGRYRIISSLGQGGMGAVYQAEHLNLSLRVAIKEMIPQAGLDAIALSQLRDQFRQEAVVLSRFNQPNLVRVIDFFEDAGNVYLVMDFVEGESLSDLIARKGALPQHEVLTWARQLLDALDYCHRQDIIHRDVKPQNVIIRQDGQAILVDFGLVKLWDPNDPRTQTAIRGAGTPEYAPPEQYSSFPGHTGPHSDIYSLGATLYHALTGQAPPTATDRMVDPYALKPPQGLNPSVLPHVNAAILKSMEPQPDHRFQNAGEMKEALEQGTQVFTRVHPQASTGASSTTTRPTGSQRRLPRWLGILGGTIALLLVCGTVAGTILLPRLLTTPTAMPTEIPAPPTDSAPSSTPVETTIPSTSTPTERSSTATPAPTATQVSRQVTVESTEARNETGIQIAAGQRVIIEYVSGSWRASTRPEWPFVGPSGDPQVTSKETFPVPDVMIMSLIGGIGDGPAFVIGSRIEFESTQNGLLWLGANDDNFADNEGRLIVQVTVRN